MARAVDNRTCRCEYEEILIDKLIDFMIFQTSCGRINLEIEHANIFIIKIHRENIEINNCSYETVENYKLYYLM